MKKFVLIYSGKVSPDDIAKEEMQAVMDKWMAWFGTFKDQMVDSGNPFAPGGKSVTASSVEVIPADRMPAKGYTIINAESMDKAVEIAKACPVLIDDSEGAVRVYEAMPM